MKKHQSILDVIFFLYPVSLGEVVRLFDKFKSYDKVINELEGLNKVVKDPKQVNLIDMISEVEKENQPKS